MIEDKNIKLYFCPACRQYYQIHNSRRKIKGKNFITVNYEFMPAGFMTYKYEVRICGKYGCQSNPHTERLPCGLVPKDHRNCFEKKCYHHKAKGGNCTVSI